MSAKGKHTPAPWRAGLGSVWTTPGEQLICAEVSSPEDAALIASAPEQQAKIDLLGDVLQFVLEGAHEWVRHDPEGIIERIETALRAIGRIP